METEKNVLGNNIRRYLNICRMTQRNLAKAVNYPASSINNIIKGKQKSIPLAKLELIAITLHVSVAELFEDQQKDEVITHSLNRQSQELLITVNLNNLDRSNQ